MPSVYYCSKTNSTFFTTCCHVAICDDQQKCPRCKEDVFPFWKGMTDEQREDAASGYFHSNTRQARSMEADR